MKQFILGGVLIALSIGTFTTTAQCQTTESESLQSTLNQRKSEFEKTAPDDLKQIYAEGIKSVESSGILSSALNVGDKAPNFSLSNALGQPVSLSDYLKKGTVILTWYRGGWCPYCNLTLHRLQEELPNFKAAGANLLALTPELPDKSISTAEKHSLQFEVLSDVGNKVAREFGVVFKLTPAVAEKYQKAFDLHGFNGDESDELPLAATYVIDSSGIIRYAFLDTDYRNRAEPADIIKALKALD